MNLSLKRAVSGIAMGAALAALPLGVSAKTQLRPVRPMSIHRHGVYEAVAPDSEQPHRAAFAAKMLAAQPRVGAVPGFVIDSQFEGINLIQTIALGSGAIPPDHGGAANTNYVLQIVNGGAAVYDHQGKLLSKLKTDSGFWRAAGIPAALLVNGVSDPRITWDQASQRWFVSQINLDFSPSNVVFIAVSKTANPLEGFRAVYARVKAGTFGDFPTLGVNADAVTVSTNNFASGVFFSDLSVLSFPKADLLLVKPTAARLNRFDTVDPATYGFALQPVNSLDPSDTSQDLVGVSATKFFEFRYSKLIDLGEQFAGISTAVSVPTKYDGNPPLGRQPVGSGYDNSDDRIGAKITQVGKYIYVTNGVSDSARGATKLASQIHWLIIDRTTQKIVAEGRIADPARKIDYSYPAIDANANGRFIIGYNGSSTTSNISAYATICDFNKVAVTVTCTAPKLLRYGLDDNYDLGFPGRVRWGDYNAVQLDPDNANAFWLFQEFPGYRQLRKNGTYGARWATVVTHMVTQ